MHDVTKRGLALAVAAGGLLITGAAPAVSAVSTHPGLPDQAGTKSQPTSDSSHHAAIPVSGQQVKQYAGRHKAAKAAKLTQAARAAKAAEAAEAAEAPVPHAPATHPVAAHHATHVATAAHHATADHDATPQHAPHHTAWHHTAPHHNAPHHNAPHHTAPHHTAFPPRHGTAASQPATETPTHAWSDDEADGAQAEASDIGGGGLLAGNTVEVPVDAPVNVCGVVTTVLGGGDNASDDHCVNGAHTAGGPSSSASADTADNPGALSGNVVQVPVSLPTNICGDTVTAVGANDSAEGILCANEGSRNSSTARATAVNSPGLVNGNVIQVPVDAPLNLCGITANVVGADDTAAGNTCVNGGEHGHHPLRTREAGMEGPSAGAGAQAVTANSSGAVTGNIVQVPIEAPVNVCGDSVDVVGALNSALDNHCVNNTAGGSAAEAHAVGDNGLAAGNVAQLPVNIPTEICGVVAAVGSYHATAEDNSCVNTGAATTTTIADASGSSGIISGNALQGPVNAPIELCGTALAAASAASRSEDTECGNGPVNCPPPPEYCPPPPVYCPPPPPENCPPPPPPHHHCPPPPHHHCPPPHHHHQPPPPPVFPPPPHHEEITQLPHTGTDVLDFAGLGAGALLLGAGAVYAGRRKSGSAN